jgi:hypothetical protein
MENPWTLTKTFLLVASFFSFQSASLFAQTTLFLISPNWKQASLTHAVFHGSNHHYETTPFTAGENSISDDLRSTVGRRENTLLPWKYKIVATVFWVGEQAAEGNPVPNTASAWDPSWATHFGGEG